MRKSLVVLSVSVLLLILASSDSLAAPEDESAGGATNAPVVSGSASGDESATNKLVSSSEEPKPVAPTPTDSKSVSQRKPGGVAAFFIGCCWGPRVGTEWNEGRNLHWREWTPFAVLGAGMVASGAGACFYPFALAGTLCDLGFIGLRIWNGVECGMGMTTKEFSEKHGANWY